MDGAAARDIVAALAPTGTLRATINLGNPILATQEIPNQDPKGVSVDLSRALADRLGVGLQMLVFPAAGKAVAAVAAQQADVGFFAIDPARGAEIEFTAAYVLIEGCYLVREDSTIRQRDEVDRPGVRVAVGASSAYDLFLTRALQNATIVRAPTSPAVVDTFVKESLDVAAGVRQQLESDCLRFPGHRLLDGHFMVIRQAMGLPKSRGANAAVFLENFIEELKASGFVQQALERHGIEGAAVASGANGVLDGCARHTP